MTHRPRWRCTVDPCPTEGRWHTDGDPEKAWTRHYLRQHYEGANRVVQQRVSGGEGGMIKASGSPRCLGRDQGLPQPPITRRSLA